MIQGAVALFVRIRHNKAVADIGPLRRDDPQFVGLQAAAGA
jgi:hypothetical protein